MIKHFLIFTLSYLSAYLGIFAEISAWNILSHKAEIRPLKIIFKVIYNFN